MLLEMCIMPLPFYMAGIVNEEVNHRSIPQKDLDMTCESFLDLFQKEEPPGVSILIYVQPFPINDGIPDEDKVWTAVKQMCHGISPGASWIHVSDILYWHKSHLEIWDELVSLVQDCFKTQCSEICSHNLARNDLGQKLQNPL
jgi:hypothetical protein